MLGTQLVSGTVSVVGLSIGGGGVAISAGSTSTSTGTVVLANSNGITFGMDSAGVITATVVPGAAAGLAAVQASNTTYTSGTFVLTGSNAVTVRSGAGQAVYIDAPVQTAYQFSNANGISFGTAGSTVTATVKTDYLTTAQPPGAYLTTARASSDAVGLNTAATSVTWTVNSSGISLNAGAYLTTAAGVSHTHGSGPSLTGPVSVSSSSNAWSLNVLAPGLNTAVTNMNATINTSGISLSVAGASAGIGGIANTDTTYTSGTVLFSGQANVTVNTSVNGGSQYIRLSAAAGGGGAAVGMSTDGTTSGNSGTFTSGTWILAGSNYMTVSQSTGTAGIHTLWLLPPASDLTVGGNLDLSTTTGSNSTDVTIYGLANIVSGSGNTAGTISSFSSGTIVFAGGSNITLSQSSNTISIVAGTAAADGINVIQISGNTSGTTSSQSTGTVVLAGGSNITLSQSSNTITIIGGAGTGSGGGAAVGISTAGNTAGTTGTFSSGTYVFEGSNSLTVSQLTGGGGVQTLRFVPAMSQLTAGANITLSSAGSTISIIGAAAGTGAGISGIAGSDTTYTTGTVVFTGSNAVTVRSSTGQSIVIDAPVQSQQPMYYSASGTSTSSNTLQFSNSNGVTWGLTNGAVIASVETNYQSTGAYLTTARASNDAIGLNTGATNVTWTVNSSGISVNAAGYAGTNFAGTNILGTLNSAGLSLNADEGHIVVSAGTRSDEVTALHFVDSNGVSWGKGSGANSTQLTATVKTDYQSSNANYLTSQSVQPAVGSLNGSSATMSISAGNLISISNNNSTVNVINLLSSSATAVDVASVSSAGSLASRYALADHQHAGVGAAGASNVGSTAGNTGTRVGTWVFAGSNQVTVSAQTGAAGVHTIHIQATTAAQSNQTGTVYAASNTTGTSSGTYDARTLSIAGDGIISVAASNSGFRISATVPAQTNQSGNVYAISNTYGTSSGTYDARTLSIAGAGIISVAASNSGFRISASQSAQSAIQALGVSNTGTTAGNTGVSTGKDWVIAASGNITASQSTGAGANTIWLSVAAAAGDGVNVVSASGNTSGTLSTQSTGTMVLAGGNNITLSQSSNTISIVGGAGGGGAAVGLSTGGNTAGTTATYTSGTYIFEGSNSMTLSQITGAGGVHTLRMYPAMSQLAAGANISLSSNGSTITISASGGAGGIAAGVSNTGNTAGNTSTFSTGTIVFAASNGMTLSQSTGGASVHTIWFQPGGGGGVAMGVSNTGSTAGNTGTYSSGTIVLAASNSATLSQSTGAGSVHTIWVLPMIMALSGGAGISLSTTGSTIVIQTVTT